MSATDTNAMEKAVFSDIDDPDQRPCKKIRLSWVIQGIRGTKEKPNRARIMTSPSVCIDGKYWNIKFFPRGNKSRNSLSAYVRCSPVEPSAESEDLEGSFKAWEGAPDADLSKLEPVLDLELRLPEVKEEEEPPPTVVGANKDKEPVTPQPGSRRGSGEDDESVSGDDDDRPESSLSVSMPDDYRVSAQLGLVVYNPAEPRTYHTQSASHQFYPHQDDWGWDTAVSQWEDIHRRRHGQRQALLRNDTLAVEAYVRIYDDPTKALFWHSSPGETQWDAKGLAGVFPVGTRLLYHSPATAGTIAWTLLSPFRSIIQKIDAGIWRKDSAVRPRPLIAHLQLMLFQMRYMKKEELYVRLDNVIHEITRWGESFDNVSAYWDALRRSIEIETKDDHEVDKALVDVFGTREQTSSIPLLPVSDVKDFQDSANKAFETSNFKGPLPNVLPLTLQRQSFDAEKRQWQLHNDRVKISEELDLSRFCEDADGKYTLYGLIIHDGERTSGKFFSVLRPTGPGGKWLAFSDGNGNKVFSYTKKRVLDYEGLTGHELKKPHANGQTIHTALYVRSARLAEYLTDSLGPYQLPHWLKSHLDETYHLNADSFGEPDDDTKDKLVDVEVFWDKSVGGQEGKLDLFTLKSNEKAHQAEHRQILTAHKDATMTEIKIKLASILEVDEKAFKLWAMNYNRLGGLSKGYMRVLPDESTVRSGMNTSLHLDLWLTMIPEKYEVAEDVLAKNFQNIGGTHVEAAPKPEPVVEEPKPAAEPAAVLGDVDAGAEQHMSPEPAPSSDSEAAADVEQDSVREAVEQSTSTGAHGSETDEGGSATTSAHLVDGLVTDAAPDAEQAAVQEAVERSIQEQSAISGLAAEGQRKDWSCPRCKAEYDELSILDKLDPERGFYCERCGQTLVQNEGTATPSHPSTGPHTITDHANTGADSVDSTSPNEGLQEPPADADRIESSSDALPTTPRQSVVDAPTSDVFPVTPFEPALPAPDNSTTTGGPPNDALDGSGDSRVVHGHRSEASLNTGAPHSPTESRSEAPLGHGEPLFPVGIPMTVGGDQIILVQPGQEDISAEDAALISQMIAADLAAAEQSSRAGENTVPVHDAESDGEEEAVDSRPMTPRQRVVPDVYGFLHIFDAESQKLTAHGTFMVPRDINISSMVRKKLAYDEDKAFHLWKRDGTYRTVGVSLESTFQDASLQDCCEVIVGDHLGETKIEALKAEAKLVDPGQLMRYLAMVARGHPTASLTTEEPIELNDFGSDYYHGPLVRGQRHGASTKLITQAGDVYVGPLISNQKSGPDGTITYANGDTYTGSWLDDLKHGQGTFLEHRTGNKYVGGYENDKRWGKGVTYWEQADQQASLCQVCYFEEVDALFYRCGHVVACFACARQCASEGGGCPVCRKPIEAVVKMYRS